MRTSSLEMEESFPVEQYLTRYIRQTSGGLVLVDKALLAKQRKSLGHMVKEIAKYIKEGRSLMSLSLPVYVFEPKSLLHRVCYMLGYAPVFLERAATEDPIERIKLVVAFGVTLLHLCTEQRKPFNPILGETLQGRVGSAEVYAEQTSHHPPISNFLLFGTDYTVTGYHEFSARARPNSIKARQRGLLRVDFNTESVFLSLPYASIKGVLLGKRVFNWKGVMTVCDPRHRLFAQIVFNAKKGNVLQRVMGQAKVARDYFEGMLLRVNSGHPALNSAGLTAILESCESRVAAEKGDEGLARISGNWPLHLDIGGRRYWSVEHYRPLSLRPVPDLLPSDSRLRPDLVALEENDEPRAQAAKESLEELQRHDAKTRSQSAV